MGGMRGGKVSKSDRGHGTRGEANPVLSSIGTNS